MRRAGRFRFRRKGGRSLARGGARQTARTVEQMVKLSEQLNEALSQFRISAAGPAPVPSPGGERAQFATASRH